MKRRFLHRVTSASAPKVVGDFGDDEDGAVLVVCLAGILIILLLALMTYDAGLATKDKTKVQAAADFSALSQASVKARSMNMMVYSNITKRSIWAAHSLYPAHIAAYRDLLVNNLLPHRCDFVSGQWQQPEDRVDMQGSVADPDDIEDFDRCDRALANLTQYEAETQGSGSFANFSGVDYSGSDPGALDAIVPDEESLSLRYYARDLHALDNYQRFIVGATPWWAWVEKLLTGIRNGATLTASYPGPPISGMSSVPNFGSFDELVSLTNNSDINAINLSNLDEDSLPIEPAGIGSMESHITSSIQGAMGGDSAMWQNIRNMQGSVNDPFVLEHLANNSQLVSRSEGLYNCAGDLNLGPDCDYYGNQKIQHAWGDAPVNSFLNEGLAYSRAAFDLYNPSESAEPWRMRDYSGGPASRWLTDSSNLVITYMADHGFRRGDVGREKFDFFGSDPTIDGDFYEEGDTLQSQQRQSNMYGAVGYWGMASGEMTFGTDGHPDLWHPAWTSKLRPVSLPNEFRTQGLEMGRMYHHMLPHLRLAQQLGLTDMDDIDTGNHARDFARMDWIMRSFSADTVEGVAK